MHILVTNDDGPPSNQTSPYIHSMVTTLQSAGHTVSVVLPHIQRSWVGKAHLIGQTLTPSYFRPGTLHEDNGVISTTPDKDGEEEWTLIDGTPASCVQIGLAHLFQDRGPVDLVLSGPNYGRNSTAVFSLSSGTIGGAMEGAVCGKKAIALSYAFDSRVHEPEIIAAASDVSRRLIEKLVREWPEPPTDIHLYSINVPLRTGVESTKIMYTKILQNRWTSASAFEQIEVDVDIDGNPVKHRKELSEGDDNLTNGMQEIRSVTPAKLKQYKWAPVIKEVYDSVTQAGPGSDGWALTEGTISVTPLRATFCAVTRYDGEEIKLDMPSTTSSPRAPAPIAPTEHRSIMSLSPSSPEVAGLSPLEPSILYALVDYPDDYVQPLMIRALKLLLPTVAFELITSLEQAMGKGTTDDDDGGGGDDDDDDNKSSNQPRKSAPVHAAKHISGSTSMSCSTLSASLRLFQFRSYESVDFSHALKHPDSSLVCAYAIRKALIRKHFLSSTIETWVTKKRTGAGGRSEKPEGEKPEPGSPLERHVKASVHFELDYAEFLDEALVDAWDLIESLERNQRLQLEDQSRSQRGDTQEKSRERIEWWILKPGMSDGGNGIRLFSSMEELKEIFEEWEEEEQEEGEADDEDGGDVEQERSAAGPQIDSTDRIVTSQLRHFIAQPYIDPPLLLSSMGDRKFHLRLYVLAVGALKVYVYREILALFAAERYRSPSSRPYRQQACSGEESDPAGDRGIDMAPHLTNTCLQTNDAWTTEAVDTTEMGAKARVKRFWGLDNFRSTTTITDTNDITTAPPIEPLPQDWKTQVFQQICQITGDLFEAAAREQPIHFQPLPNAFEIFGVDFLVDAACHVWLLEVNAFPDFRQTGAQLREEVIGELFKEVVRKAVRPFFGWDQDGEEDNGNKQGDSEPMVLVRELDLGRR